MSTNHQTTNSRRDFISQTSLAGVGAMLTASQWQRVLGANERIRLGVIGTGNRGQYVMSLFQKQSEVDVVALCDVYDRHLNQALEKTGGQAKTYDDYRKLLESKDVDAVLIATPDHWHAEMAIDACRAGKDIYIEKPLTYTIEEGYKILKAVRESKCVFQVGLQQRSGQHYWEAKREYFDSGKIGKVTLVRTWWHGNSYHLRRPNFTEKPAGLDWKKFLGPLKYREFNAHQFYNWRAYLDFGGGQITDLFTHWIDVVHWFMGEDLPISATAAGGVYHYQDGRTAPDTISLQLEYPGGWTATFDATLVPGASGAAIEFMGTGGRLKITRGGYLFQEQTPRREAPKEPITCQVTEDITVDHVNNFLECEADIALMIVSEDITVDHVKNFLECLRSRKTPNSDVLSGHRSALASHLCKLAYLQKERIKFDPASEKGKG